MDRTSVFVHPRADVIGRALFQHRMEKNIFAKEVLGLVYETMRHCL